MKTQNVVLAGVGASVLAALSTGVIASTAAPAPTRPVEIDKLFNGRWAEIGRTPMKLTDGCVAGATTYTMVSATRVEVRDTCREKTPTGKEKGIGGPGTILDPGTNTKLHVSYRVLGIFPLGRDYWILDHADDYSWFISADPAFKNLWIYARDPPHRSRPGGESRRQGEIDGVRYGQARVSRAALEIARSDNLQIVSSYNRSTMVTFARPPPSHMV